MAAVHVSRYLETASATGFADTHVFHTWKMAGSACRGGNKSHFGPCFPLRISRCCRTRKRTRPVAPLGGFIQFCSGVPSKGRSSPGSPVRLHVNWWAIPVEFHPFQVTIWSILEPSELPDAGEMVIHLEPSMGGKEQWLNYCDLNWGSRPKGNSSAVCLLSVESFVCEIDERNSVE